MPYDRCSLCRAPYEVIPGDPERIDSDSCKPCRNAEARFTEFNPIGASASYVYHEVAHAVMLWNRVPSHKRDWERMDRALDKKTQGWAQIHAMRTLALQGLAYEQLGWKPSWRTLVSFSWGALREVDNHSDRGTRVVKTEAAAWRYVLRCRERTSKQKICIYVRALQTLQNLRQPQRRLEGEK